MPKAGSFVSTFVGRQPVIDPRGILAAVGLHPQIKGVADGYFGLRTSVADLNIWRNLPSPHEPKLSQLWHRDLMQDRHLIKVYGLSGFLAGLAGMVSLARFATTTIGGHSTDNLAAIAAVVLGGTSLFGGIGTVLGTVVGVFIPAVLQNGFVILGV